mgnify:CR=1 FL=1
MRETIALDLGSGPQPANPFKADRVIGIDSQAKGENVLNCWVGIEKIPLENSCVDVVTAFDFLEHLPRSLWKDDEIRNLSLKR